MNRGATESGRLEGFVATGCHLQLVDSTGMARPNSAAVLYMHRGNLAMWQSAARVATAVVPGGKWDGR